MNKDELMDYFEKCLGDTVERKGDKFIIKDILNKAGIECGKILIKHFGKTRSHKQANDE